MDKLFKIETLRKTSNPQQLIWLAAHQDYSENFVAEELEKAPKEKEAGELIVKHLLAGNRGHYGCFEHPQITFNVGYFPHSMMQQIRTHRAGISFDVQSFRYTGKRIYNLGESFYKLMTNNSDLFWRLDRDWLIKVEELFYIRPEGEYTDRKGKRYVTTFQHRRTDLLACGNSAIKYYLRLEEGYSEEHARSLIPFDVRQHFVVSCNLRSLMHLLDLRWKKDAQLEAQQFCDLLFEKFEEWTPAVARWYLDNRGKKARLSP